MPTLHGAGETIASAFAESNGTKCSVLKDELASESATVSEELLHLNVLSASPRQVSLENSGTGSGRTKNSRLLSTHTTRKDSVAASNLALPMRPQSGQRH